MPTRRSLLLGALPLLLPTPGCAVIPSGGGPKTPLPWPSPEWSPARQSLLAVHRTTSAALEGDWGATQAELDTLGWMLSVCQEQADAVSVELPGPAPSPVPESPDDPPIPHLVDLLADARATYVEAASDPGIASTLLWASMAAWTAAATTALRLPDPALGIVRERIDPAPGSPSETAHAAASAAYGTAYGLEAVAGTPGLPTEQRSALAQLARKWRRWGESLVTDVGSGTLVPEPYYQVPRPGSPGEAVLHAGRMLASLLPHIGRAIATAEPEWLPGLIVGLIDAAEQAPKWGARVDRWPGLP